MTGPSELKKASRFLAHVLRHGPESIGIRLDANGWASMADIVRKAARHGKRLTPELIRSVVATSDKQRFALSDDGLRIRANQGHSIADVDLGLQPTEPPEFLFHGTALHHLASIRAHGISKGKRNHVHLSPDEGTALRVGQRHGKPVVLRVLARAMHEKGFEFYLSANGVWLTFYVPAEFVQFGWNQLEDKHQRGDAAQTDVNRTYRRSRLVQDYFRAPVVSAL